MSRKGQKEEKTLKTINNMKEREREREKHILQQENRKI